jgi:2,4-diketo-3-deoxy-L-fuconate hydrolase
MSAAGIATPSKLLFCGVNYASHKEENPAAVMPSEPFFFAKLPSAIVAAGEPIVMPYPDCWLDYEVELAMVIGARARNLTPENAIDCVEAYTLVNDVSARDVQFRDSQVTLGKNFDTFCPLGPRLVPAASMPPLDQVLLRTTVNGEVRQEESAGAMIFSITTLLCHLSRVMTLEPGDVVTTGTPAGVAAFREPSAYLRPGDVVRVEAEQIGVLENEVVAGW